MKKKKSKWGKDLKMPGLKTELGLVKRLTDYEVPDDLVFFTVDEVAAIFRVNPNTIKNNINSGTINATRLFKKSKGMDRISLTEMKRLVNEGIDFRKTIGKERIVVHKKQIKQLREENVRRKRKMDKMEKTNQRLREDLETLMGGRYES